MLERKKLKSRNHGVTEYRRTYVLNNDNKLTKLFSMHCTVVLLKMKRLINKYLLLFLNSLFIKI